MIGWLSSGLRETNDAVRLPGFRRGLNEAAMLRCLACRCRRVGTTPKRDDGQRLASWEDRLAQNLFAYLISAGRELFEASGADGRYSTPVFRESKLLARQDERHKRCALD